MITGSVKVDLTALATDRYGWIDPNEVRHAVDGVTRLPDESRLLLVVGALRPHPEVIRLLSEHTSRLKIHLQAADLATVQAWHDSLVCGDVAPKPDAWS